MIVNTALKTVAPFVPVQRMDLLEHALKSTTRQVQIEKIYFKIQKFLKDKDSSCF